ncbi:GH11819 [Drosophila grimshawi]|uniref:GH11819 n=1 Tax=Drosophila grimshawi TaxID=7222 RepID=B4JIR3_DROGR|nr:GH11819 [Drosophila grimshawi]
MAQQQEKQEQQEDLPNASVRQTLEQLLGCKDYGLELACAKGDNYLGIVWRIHQEVEGQRSLILKLPPQNTVRRKQFFARPCFTRESLAYEEFLPLIQRFQADQKLSKTERFRQHARCLVTRQDEPNECIVLEDLCRRHYQLHDRFTDLTPAHVSLVMGAYAKLHATSLALKAKCKSQQQQQRLLLPFQTLVDIFEQRRNDAALGAYFEQLKQNALDALHQQQDAHYVQRLQAYFGRGSYFELLLPLLSGMNCEPYAVVCHGDSWNNNFLYKCDVATKQPLDVCLIDWQLMRYASPITDLVYFLFSCTTRQFRQQHFRPMLQLYYKELGQQLARLGETAATLFPFDAFEQQLREKGAVGLLLAMMVLPIVTMRGEDVPDLQVISDLVEGGASTSGFLGVGNESLYKQRMRDVILDCVDYEYI